MVATIETTPTEYVLGNTPLKRSEISLEDWVNIITQTVKDAPLEFMTGFLPIPNVIKSLPFGGCEKEVNPGAPLEFTGPVLSLKTVFLCCGKVEESTITEHKRIRETMLLLTRKGQFCIAKSTWSWTPPEFEWCQSSIQRLAETQVEHVHLPSLLADLQGQELGKVCDRILWMISDSLEKTKSALNEKLARASKVAETVSVRRSRIGKLQRL